MRLPDPAASKTRFTLYVLTVDGGMYTGWLSQQLHATGRDPRIATDYVHQLCVLFPAVSPHPEKPDALTREIGAAEIGARLDEFRQVVTDLADRLKSVR